AARGVEDLTPPLTEPPQPPPALSTEDVEQNAQKFVTTYLFEHVAEHVNKTTKPAVAFGYNDVLLMWDYREARKAEAQAGQPASFFAVVGELRNAAEDKRDRWAAAALLVFNTLNLAANMPSGPYTEEQRKVLAKTLPGMLERIREHAESVEKAEALFRQLPAGERKALADMLLTTADWRAERCKQLLKAKDDMQAKGLLEFALRTEREHFSRTDKRTQRLYTYYLAGPSKRVFHGVDAEWHASGPLASYHERRHGKSHGVLLTWDERGRPTLMARFADGKPTDFRREWQNFGTKHATATETRYTDPQSGTWTRWNCGRAVEAGEFRDGKPCGTTRSWYDNGKPKCFTTYRDGVTIYQRTFYETGKPESEGALGPGGRTGVWKYWDPDGKVTEKKEGG
ncbi:MAG: hypothetical protein ABIN58_08330, partial [candidate division WOR-3 bacterium]